MAPQIFLTGATGYVGGEFLDQAYNAYPDYNFTLLVRNEERGKPVKDKYPKANLVYGMLDDAAVVEKAAKEADIVIHTADSSDNAPGATAIAKGLAAGHTAEKPGYWLHVSGTSILTWYDATHDRRGEAPLPEQEYKDMDGIEQILNFPDEAHHRDVEKMVQAASSDAVKIAICCPPTIHGTGSGPVNTRSMQLPRLAKATLERGFAPYVGTGETEWDNVHVKDVAQLLLKLVDATQDPHRRGDAEIFGPRGYYFIRSGWHRWSDVARWVAEEASRQGYLPDAVVKSVTPIEMSSLAGSSYGVNSKGVPQRASKYLGWEAKGGPLKDFVAEAVAREAKALELQPKEKKG